MKPQIVLTADQLQQAAAMRERGDGTKLIGAALGYSHQVIERNLKEAGLYTSTTNKPKGGGWSVKLNNKFGGMKLI